MQPKSRAFTAINEGGIARVVMTPMQIIAPLTNKKINVNAIWDTGATGTCITKKLVAALGLLPTGKVNVNTAAGPVIQNSYIVDGVLPNQVHIKGINVLEIPGLSDNCEVLIGMDIISLGDFSICNHNGKTVVSFRVPSLHSVDYVKNPDHLWPADATLLTVEKSNLYKPRAAGNDKCPCGSGRQHKRCCGKRA